MRHRTLRLLAVIILVGGCSARTQSGRIVGGPLWGPLDPGPHGVGFIDTLVVDTTRTDSAAWHGRPIRLLVWYPAANTERASFRFGDYFLTDSLDDWTGRYTSMLARRDLDVARRQFSPPSDSLLSALFQLPVPAVANARATREQTPLVVYTGGRNNYQQEGTVLWEYLATRGYTVIVVPQFGSSIARAAVSFTMPDMLTLAADIGIAIRTASGFSFVDPNRVALVGHSSGAIAGLIATTQLPAIDVLIGLDGSTTTEEGSALVSGTTVALANVRATIVEIFAQGKRGYATALIDSIHAAPRHLIGLGAGTPPSLATHFDFQMWPVIGVVLPSEDPRAAGARPSSLGAAFYWTAVRLTAELLDAAFEGRANHALDLAGVAVQGVDVNYKFLPATARVP